jgi:hypothetical protein
MTRNRQQTARLARGLAIYSAFAAVMTLGGALWFLPDRIAPFLFAMTAFTAFYAWVLWWVANALKRPRPAGAAGTGELDPTHHRRQRPRVVAVQVLALTLTLAVLITSAIAFGWKSTAILFGASFGFWWLLLAIRAVARRRSDG